MDGVVEEEIGTSGEEGTRVDERRSTGDRYVSLGELSEEVEVSPVSSSVARLGPVETGLLVEGTELVARELILVLIWGLLVEEAV
jgi:hypothetical protein